MLKRKSAIAKQASLELSLAEQKEFNRIQEERLRISRELHDNIGSYLTLMSASVEGMSFRNSVESDHETSLKEIKHLQETVTMGMRELRKTVWLLNNRSVSIDDLTVRIRDFFMPLQSKGVTVDVKTEGCYDKKLNDIQTTQFFRVIQESVNNSYKYSECSRIEIRLEVSDSSNKLNFSISDNGIGFNSEEVKHGNGIKNIKSRIAAINGEVRIKSKIGKGTIVEGSFPLENTNKYV